MGEGLETLEYVGGLNISFINCNCLPYPMLCARNTIDNPTNHILNCLSSLSNDCAILEKDSDPIDYKNILLSVTEMLTYIISPCNEISLPHSVMPN